MSLRSIHPVPLLLMGVAGIVAGYALVVSAIAVLEPDPERWQGWGPMGLAAASAMLLAGLALALWRPTIGAVLGSGGAILAIAAAPWLWFIAVLLGVAPAIPFLARRSRTPSAAGAA